MATDQGKTSNLNAMAIVAQELERADSAGGTDDVSHALHAGDLRQLGRHFARRSVRSGAHHPDPRLGAGPGRGVRECRPVEARALFSAGGRGHARRGGARMPRGAQRLRNIRCLDARQDRGRRPRCGRIHEPPVHQQLVEPGRRPLALRDPAARGRLHLRRRRGGAHRRGSISRHDHHRRRAARARADGGLPSDRMAGSEGLADLDHRAMGGHRRARTARAPRTRAVDRGHRYRSPRPGRT